MRLPALLAGIVLVTASVARSAPGDILLFENDEFTPRDPAWNYEALTFHELFDLSPLPYGELRLREDGAVWPNEGRWRGRSGVLALVYMRVPAEEKSYFRRALELATWMSLHAEGATQGVEGEYPLTLGPEEARDLLALERCMRAAEDRAVLTH